MEASQNAYDVTTPLLRQVPQSALDAVFGASALVTPDLKLAVVGRTWDEFMARSGRNDLARNAMLGSTVLLFFRNDEQRRVFESLLHSMHSDELGVHNQVVDLGTKEKSFYVQLHVQGLWQDGIFAGYFIHCLDITREHSNRLGLIERDRELLNGRENAEKAVQQVQVLQEKLRAATEEITQREAQLKKIAEKSMRLDKTSREALERAEKSVEKCSRLQHELDKLKKQQTEESTAKAELEQQKAQNAKLATELEAAQATHEALAKELVALKEQLAAQAEGESADKSKLLSEIEDAQAQHSAVLNELNTLKEQQAAAATSESEKLAKLGAELENSEKKFVAAQKEIAGLKEQLAAAAANETSTTQEIAELKANLKLVSESSASSSGEHTKLAQTLEARSGEISELKASMAKLEQSLKASQSEASEAKSALEEAKSKPAKIVEKVVKDVVKDPSAQELLSYISQKACYLDTDGKVTCATGSFWEQMGVVPDKGPGLTFAKWLNKDDAAKFNEWLKAKSESSCKIATSDGSTWTACSVTDADGNWVGVGIEEANLPVTTNMAPSPFITFAPQLPSHMRTLSRELADEFSNLLTGVLGHASLAAAEQDGTTSREIVEIEKSAREAAHLVRKLSALGGQGRHAHECDLNPTLQQFVKKLQPGFFGERPQIVLCVEGCRVNAEANSLRTVLEAVTAHARENLAAKGHVCFTLSYTDSEAFISLSYDGEAGYPAGWSDGLPPAIGQQGWDLVFAREVLRGMGGELELSEDEGQSLLLLTFPRLKLVGAV